MFDIGWTELLVIGVVALIVVGPKDLPGMFRTLGRFTAKAKGMAREFSRAMEDAADDAGVKDIAGDLKNMTSSKNLGLDKVQDAASKFEKWDPLKSATTKKGPATQALSEERAAAAKKIHDATSKKASERLAKQAASQAAEVADIPKKATPKNKTAPRKAAGKTTSAKPKATAKPKAKPTKTAVKKPVAKKSAAKKPAAKASE